MAKMMNRNYRRIVGMGKRYNCPCCPDEEPMGRAAEKREWRMQLAEDIWDARSEGVCTCDYCTEKEG